MMVCTVFRLCLHGGVVAVAVCARMCAHAACAGDIYFFDGTRVGAAPVLVLEQQVISAHYFNMLRSRSWQCLQEEASAAAAAGAPGMQPVKLAMTTGGRGLGTQAGPSPPIRIGTSAPTAPPTRTPSPTPAAISTPSPRSPTLTSSPAPVNAGGCTGTSAAGAAHQLSVSVAVGGVPSSALKTTSGRASLAAAMKKALAQLLSAQAASGSASSAPLTVSNVTVAAAGSGKAAWAQFEAVVGHFNGTTAIKAAASALRDAVLSGKATSALRGSAGAKSVVGKAAVTAVFVEATA